MARGIPVDRSTEASRVGRLRGKPKASGYPLYNDGADRKVKQERSVLRGLDLNIDPRGGSSSSEVDGDGEVIDVGPLDKASTRLFVTVRAALDQRHRTGSDLIVDARLFIQGRGHVAISSEHEGQIKTVDLLHHPLVEVKVVC